MTENRLEITLDGDSLRLWRTLDGNDSECFYLDYDEIYQLKHALPDLLPQLTTNRDAAIAAKKGQLRQQIALAQAELDAMDALEEK